jgi:hypothetical protein
VIEYWDGIVARGLLVCGKGVDIIVFGGDVLGDCNQQIDV